MHAPRPRVHEARRILVCLRWGIGDVVTELPALAALRRAAPWARLDALGAPPALELVEGEGDVDVDGVWSTAALGLRHWGDPGDGASHAEIRAWLAGCGFDLVLDAAHAATAVRHVLRREGVATRNADPKAERDALARGRPGWRALQEGVRVGWGVEGLRGEPPSLTLGEEERREADRLLRDRVGVAVAPAAVSDVASSPLKRWPTDRLVEVARRLRAQGPVLALEGPDGGALQDLLPEEEGFVTVGPMPLRRLAALVARCRVLVCNDTGLLHLAASVGTPVIGVFGPTRPEIYLPSWGRAAAVCPEEPCPHRETEGIGPPECVRLGRCLAGRGGCLQAVASERVLERAGALVAPSRGDPARASAASDRA